MNQISTTVIDVGALSDALDPRWRVGHYLVRFMAGRPAGYALMYAFLTECVAGPQVCAFEGPMMRPTRGKERLS